MSTREFIDKGTAANDGSGDTLRSGGTKIDNNFLRLWLWAGGDSNSLSSYISIDSDEIVFEGTSIDAFETRVKAIDPTSDNVVLVPDASGTLVLGTNTQTLTNKTLTDPVLTLPQINDSDGSFQYIVTPKGGLVADRTIYLPVLSDSDTFVFTKATQTLTNKTLTNPALTDPNISDINDVNGSPILEFNPTSSAVVNWTMSNGATSGVPILSATGSDTHINAYINAKGRGAVRVSKFATQKGDELTTSTDADRDRSFIDINSGSSIAIGIVDGDLVGEWKTLVNRGAGTATVTPTNFGNGTSFTLAQNEACILIWNGINWYLNGNQSVVTIS